MRYTTYLLFIAVIAVSCAVPAQYKSTPPCSGGLDAPFSPYGEGRYVSIFGRAKIVMPKYRVRGICRIQSEPSGALVVDFEHSSLFGAYREDATIRLEEGELLIFDRERGRMYDNDASLSILGSELTFELFPDDIRYVMLFAVPDCNSIEGLVVDSDDGRWRFTGEWRGRNIEMEGRGGYGPERLTLCSKDRDDCYTISYKQARGGVYPSGLELVREGGEERISLEIIDVQFSSLLGGTE